MKTFKNITNSAEPRIIGVYNGVYQVSLDDFIGNPKNDAFLTQYFFQPDMSKIEEHSSIVFKLIFPKIKGEMLKKAIVTGLMGFDTYIFGVQYIVSERFVKCLIDSNIEQREYKLFPIELGNIRGSFFLFYVPLIGLKEINFQKSLLYKSKDYNIKDKEYLNINSESEFKNLEMNSYFDKICLNKKHHQNNILNIQGSSGIFFSNNLIREMQKSRITGFEISKTKIEIIFFDK